MSDPTACDRTDMPSDPDALCSNCGYRADAHAGWSGNRINPDPVLPWDDTIAQDES